MIVALWKQKVFTYQILPKGTTVDSMVYLLFLEKRMWPEVRRRHMSRPIILHDNARPHKHCIIREFLQARKWEELEHPPYSPDMSPPDMHCISRLKAPHNGKRFESERELQDDYEDTIRQVSENDESRASPCYPTAGEPLHVQPANMSNNAEYRFQLSFSVCEK